MVIVLQIFEAVPSRLGVSVLLRSGLVGMRLRAAVRPAQLPREGHLQVRRRRRVRGLPVAPLLALQEREHPARREPEPRVYWTWWGLALINPNVSFIVSAAVLVVFLHFTCCSIAAQHCVHLRFTGTAEPGHYSKRT